MTQHALYLPGTAARRPIRLVRDPQVRRLARPVPRSGAARTTTQRNARASRATAAKRGRDHAAA